MTIEFKLPDIGEGVAEGEIVQWLVQEGDAVAEHQAIVEVMTDKATVEIPAPAAGTVTKIQAAPGDVVPVGTVIFTLEAGSGAAPAAAPKAAPAAAAAPQSAPAPAPAPRSAPAPAASSRPQPAAAAAPAAAAGGGELLRFALPDVGEGVAEGEIVQWLVQVGDAVAEHQPVVEVMTDKATVEIPAPAPGTIAKILVEPGAVVPVGEILFELQKQGAAAPVAAAAPAPAAAQPAPALVGAGVGTSANGGKVLAVPSARRVARELGIDLSQVAGTGRNGVVRRADVEAFATGAAAAAPSHVAAAPQPSAAASVAAAPSSAAGARRVPFRGVRRKIAEAMTRSKHTAAHFTVVEEVDVTELVALRAKAKALGAEQDVKVTYMPFIMKAVALGLARFPMLNGHLDEEAGEIVLPASVNLGIATDTATGLIVPVVPEVQSKGVLQLARELNDLAARTREGKVKPDELRGSTFSITNAGNIGGTFATPIINFPDIAILGVHRISKRPGVVETPEGDVIEVRQYMNFSCSVDHRLADGADAARFLVYLKRLLEDPGLLAL